MLHCRKVSASTMDPKNLNLLRNYRPRLALIHTEPTCGQNAHSLGECNAWVKPGRFSTRIRRCRPDVRSGCTLEESLTEFLALSPPWCVACVGIWAALWCSSHWRDAAGASCNMSSASRGGSRRRSPACNRAPCGRARPGPHRADRGSRHVRRDLSAQGRGAGRRPGVRLRRGAVRPPGAFPGAAQPRWPIAAAARSSLTRSGLAAARRAARSQPRYVPSAEPRMLTPPPGAERYRAPSAATGRRADVDQPAGHRSACQRRRASIPIRSACDGRAARRLSAERAAGRTVAARHDRRR